MLPRSAIAGALALALALPGGTAVAQSLEYPVKAAYLYKFGPFVEWPAGAFDSAVSPLTVCIVGDDPFGPVLDRALDGQAVGQHPVAVRRLDRLDRNSACHVAYVAGSRRQSVAEGLAGVRGAPVLTVTDSGGPRGIVHFVVKDNRVRFHIDDQAAAQNGIVISSKLLSLALSVKSRRGRG